MTGSDEGYKWDCDLGVGNRLFAEVITDDDDKVVNFTFERGIFLDGEWWPVVRLLWAGDSVLVNEFTRGSREPLNSKTLLADVESADVAHDAALLNICDDDNWKPRQEEYLKA